MLKILITVLEILCKWTKSDKKKNARQQKNTTHNFILIELLFSDMHLCIVYFIEMYPELVIIANVAEINEKQNKQTCSETSDSS